ncbi:hypothetical protein J2046_002156 [Rhizobium petrolearium]|nr:hypothetical protein [Neorhizobium petrolearium]
MMMLSQIPSSQNAEQKVQSLCAADFVCWSRMQAEAGQELNSILARKENERRAGDGLFFWGVGNAPSTSIGALARMKKDVPVVFSIMKSRPKVADSSPSSLLVWRRFVDLYGVERPLPPHALITSRGDSDSGTRKTKHYALMCWSQDELQIKRGIPFDHNAYRNAGPNGAPVGASQVTALLTQATKPSGEAQYEANLEATLAGSYWIRLVDPVRLTKKRAAIYADTSCNTSSEWLDMVRELRAGVGVEGQPDFQPSLF